jgi:hypothetical protein
MRIICLRLDAASRRNRFRGGVADDVIRRDAEGAFEPENVIYGFLADEILRGAAELRRFRPERGSSRSCLGHRAGAGRATASAPSF